MGRFGGKSKFRSARQVKSAVEETQREELVNLQKDYRTTVMNRLWRGAKLKVMREQIELGKNGGQIQMEWLGMPYPLDMLCIEHDVEMQRYAEDVASENRLLDGLKVHGVTDAEVDVLLKENKFVKELRKVEKLDDKPASGDYIG